MKYAIEMGSGAKFNKFWFRNSKVDTGGGIHIQRAK
jgi:hypothetical protein